MSESVEQPKGISERILAFQSDIELVIKYKRILLEGVKESLASEGFARNEVEQTLLWHELLGSTPHISTIEKDVEGNLIEKFLDEKLRELGI